MRDEIIELLNKEPFAAFSITLTSGQRFDVTNPNLVALGETLMHIFFPRSDRYAALRLNQIASTEIAAPGRPRRRRGQ